MSSTAMIAARGAAWGVASSVASRAVGVVGTLILIRFVAPADFGEASVAAAVVATINQMTTLGVGAYVVANRNVSREEMFHATFLHVALGALACLVLLALGPVLSAAFGSPNGYRYVPGLALAWLADRVSYMPERVLVRELRFRRISLVRSAGEVIYAVVSTGAAYLGWGGMSIVIGNVARSGFRMLVMLFSVHLVEWLGIVRLQLQILRKIAAYGFAVALGGLAELAGRRWDNLLFSRMFGPALMATYSLAYNLADIPAVHVGEQISDVLVPSFAKMEIHERRRMLSRSLGVLGLVTFPLAVGLGAVAPTLADLFLDKKWAGAGLMLMVLSMMSVARPVYGAVSSYIIVEKGPRILLVLDWLAVGILLGGIALLGQLSPLWACGAAGVAFTARTLLGIYLVRASLQVPVSACLSRLWPPLLACLPMVAAVFGIRYGLSYLGVDSRVVKLGCEIVGGAVVFIGSALVLAKDAARDVLNLVRNRRAQRRGAPVQSPSDPS